MAAGTLATPGSKYGPCKSECKHVDCYETKRMAYSLCDLCGLSIGYDVRFYTNRGRPGELVHARCLEEVAAQTGVKVAQR